MAANPETCVCRCVCVYIGVCGADQQEKVRSQFAVAGGGGVREQRTGAFLN